MKAEDDLPTLTHSRLKQCSKLKENDGRQRTTAYKISYTNPAAGVFGGHLSAQAIILLES
jgi:hypothetical protein